MSYDPLFLAILDSDLEKVTLLISQRDTPDPVALHNAAYIGSIEILRLLIGNGYSTYLNTYDDCTFTPLMWSAKMGHIECVEYLLEAGSDINLNDESKIANTVLREVIEDANLEIIKLLLAWGADPYIKGWMQLSAMDKIQDMKEDNPGSDRPDEIYNIIMQSVKVRKG